MRALRCCLPLPSLGALIAALAVPAAARADGSADASLSWTRTAGAEACIDAEGLQRAVEDRLGRRVFGLSDHPELVVEGRVGRAADGRHWVAVLALRDATTGGEGAREIRTEAASCADLDAPLAVVIALMLDLPTRRVALQIPPSPRRPPAATPARAPGAAPGGSVPASSGPGATDSARASPQASTSIELRGAALFGAGALPGVAVGARLATLLHLPPVWPLTLDLSLWPAADAEEAPATARASLFHVGVGACPLHLVRGEIVALGCGGVQLGRIAVRGTSFDRNDEASGVWLGAASELRASVRVLGPFALGIGVEGGVPLLRPTLVYEDAGGQERVLFRPFPVTGAAEVGIAWTIR